MRMHASHDACVDDRLVKTTFPIVIAVSMGRRHNCELDKETRLLQLDRVLYSAVHHPANWPQAPGSSLAGPRRRPVNSPGGRSPEPGADP